MTAGNIVESSRFQRFIELYCNWEQLSSVCITFDVDFAPDYMIRHVLQILEQHGVPGTFFATHHSPLLMEQANGGKHEVGLHPNLSSTTTQGSGFLDIINNLRRSYPHAVGNRFHLLGYSYRDLAVLGREGFRYDVSTLRFNCPYTLPAWHQDIGMVLLTYIFEDGICENANLPLDLSSIDLERPGLKIINFHPMNVYINGSDAQPRLAFLQDNGDLLHCPQQVAERYRCQAAGVETVLVDLLKYLSSKKCKFLRVVEIADAYLNLVREKDRDN